LDLKFIKGKTKYQDIDRLNVFVYIKNIHYMKQQEIQELLNSIEGFNWDRWNITKNYERHGVHYLECEDIFFNEPLYITPDEKHSHKEKRFRALGQTKAGRLLTVIFTLRKNLIRVICARSMSFKERRLYHEQKET
jgi:uncharacterized DUF497 family protein